jgi:hypothetical protein
MHTHLGQTRSKKMLVWGGVAVLATATVVVQRFGQQWKTKEILLVSLVGSIVVAVAALLMHAASGLAVYGLAVGATVAVAAAVVSTFGRTWKAPELLAVAAVSVCVLSALLVLLGAWQRQGGAYSGVRSAPPTPLPDPPAEEEPVREWTPRPHGPRGLLQCVYRWPKNSGFVPGLTRIQYFVYRNNRNRQLMLMWASAKRDQNPNTDNEFFRIFDKAPVCLTFVSGTMDRVGSQTGAVRVCGDENLNAFKVPVLNQLSEVRASPCPLYPSCRDPWCYAVTGGQFQGGCSHLLVTGPAARLHLVPRQLHESNFQALDCWRAMMCYLRTVHPGRISKKPWPLATDAVVRSLTRVDSLPPTVFYLVQLMGLDIELGETEEMKKKNEDQLLKVLQTLFKNTNLPMLPIPLGKLVYEAIVVFNFVATVTFGRQHTPSSFVAVEDTLFCARASKALKMLDWDLADALTSTEQDRNAVEVPQQIWIPQRCLPEEGKKHDVWWLYGASRVVRLVAHEAPSRSLLLIYVANDKRDEWVAWDDVPPMFVPANKLLECIMTSAPTTLCSTAWPLQLNDARSTYTIHVGRHKYSILELLEHLWVQNDVAPCGYCGSDRCSIRTSAQLHASPAGLPPSNMCVWDAVNQALAQRDHYSSVSNAKTCFDAMLAELDLWHTDREISLVGRPRYLHHRIMPGMNTIGVETPAAVLRQCKEGLGEFCVTALQTSALPKTAIEKAAAAARPFLTSTDPRAGNMCAILRSVNMALNIALNHNAPHYQDCLAVENKLHADIITAALHALDWHTRYDVRAAHALQIPLLADFVKFEVPEPEPAVVDGEPQSHLLLEYKRRNTK